MCFYTTKCPYTTKERDESALTVSFCGFMVRTSSAFSSPRRNKARTERKPCFDLSQKLEKQAMKFTFHEHGTRRFRRTCTISYRRKIKEEVEEMGFELVAGIDDVM